MTTGRINQVTVGSNGGLAIHRLVRQK